MTHSSDNSVTAWIQGLKDGDDESANEIWRLYFDRLVRVANRMLNNAPRRIADEEDVAVGVFQSLCSGAAEGRFSQLTDRSDLWSLLVAIARQKAVDQIRRQTSKKRGGGEVRGESILFFADDNEPAGFEQFIAEEPTPEFIALLDEQHRQLFGSLRDDTQRSVARFRLEGYSNEEIAEKVGISLRSVERKLKLIREAWSQEVEP